MTMRGVSDPLPEGGVGLNVLRRAKSLPDDVKKADVCDQEQMQLTKACAEFEALLVQKLFQTMRASIPKSGLIDGGSAEDIYTAMLDQKVAQDMAFQGGLGLSARMKEQIVRYMDSLKHEND